MVDNLPDGLKTLLAGAKQTKAKSRKEQTTRIWLVVVIMKSTKELLMTAKYRSKCSGRSSDMETFFA